MALLGGNLKLSYRFRMLLFVVFTFNCLSLFFLVPAMCKNRNGCGALLTTYSGLRDHPDINSTTETPYTAYTTDALSTEIAYKIGYAHQVELPCPEDAGLLLGLLKVDLTGAENNYQNLTQSSPHETWGNKTYLGRTTVADNASQRNATIFHPTQCRSTYSTAIIIPFRHREEHLKYLLGHLVPILKRQLLRFAIFVVSQSGEGVFNKGRLMNTGFKYAHEAGNASGVTFDCFVFHDVDLLVEHDTLRYRCQEGNSVHHLSTAIDKYEYRAMCCGMTIGGVLAMNEEQFRKINGYSNAYAGWGGEDDDLNFRLRNKGLEIRRPNAEQGRYTMVTHGQDEGNPKNGDRYRLLNEAKARVDTDGINSLSTQIVEVQFYPLFTNLVVDIGDHGGGGSDRPT